MWDHYNDKWMCIFIYILFVEFTNDRAMFMRCHDVNAVYEITQEGHTSIVFPVGHFIQEGTDNNSGGMLGFAGLKLENWR